MVNDASQQAKFRESEEQNTLQRAGLLGLRYVDTREMALTAPLVQGVLEIEEMYKGHLVPLQAGGDSPLVFGITVNTPQQMLRQLRDRFEAQGNSVQTVMISNQGFKD